MPSTTAGPGSRVLIWPPLTVGPDGAVMGDAGATGTFATFARPDGSLQVAYDAPLYNFASDTAPGDTNGEDVAGKWFVASPGGGTPSETTPSSEGGGGKYPY